MLGVCFFGTEFLKAHINPFLKNKTKHPINDHFRVTFGVLCKV